MFCMLAPILSSSSSYTLLFKFPASFRLSRVLVNLKETKGPPFGIWGRDSYLLSEIQ